MAEMIDIIAKIQKLFALANQSKNNSEAEANAAMSKAQELLAKYNLDIAMVRDAETRAKKTPEADMTAPREQVRVNRSAMYRWQQNFWHELSLMNYCYHWTETVWETRGKRERKVKRHVILGSAVNVAAVHAMGDYLTEPSLLLNSESGKNERRQTNALVCGRDTNGSRRRKTPG